MADADSNQKALLFPIPGECLPFPEIKQGKQRPNKMVVLEIDFDVVSDKLKFYYSRVFGPIIVKDDVDFQQKIKKIAAGTLPSAPNTFKYIGQYGSKLTFSNGYYRYIVFVLTKKNWQFTQKGVPIMMQKVALDYDVYFEGRRVTPGGDIQVAGTGLDPRDLARVAYFIADGAAIVNQSTQCPPYPHGFNLYVDVFDDDDNTVMPLVVDPDIRYPGGLTLDEPDTP
jgi:hypothetical protein